MRISTFLLSAFLALCALPALAISADTPEEEMIQMYTPPNKFNLFQENSTKTLSYHTERKVRICDRQDSHSVGLMVKHDGSVSPVKAGACAVFTARNFVISPAGPVDPDFDLSGTVEKARG